MMAFFGSRAKKLTSQPSLRLTSLIAVTFLVLLISQWRSASAAAWINLARVFEMREHTWLGGQTAQDLVPAYLELASKQSPHGLADEILGDYYFRRARYADATVSLRRSRLVRPWAGWQLGFAFYQLGQTDQALSAWRTPGSVDWLVRYARQVTDDRTADELYLLALKVEPGHSQATHDLGIRYAYRALNAAFEDNDLKARYWLSHATELQIDDLTYAQLVSVTASRIGEYQLALNAALAGVRSFPDNDKIHYLAAVAYAKLGDHALAINQYNEAIAVSARKPIYQLALAELYVRLDMIAEAKALYQAVYESGDASYRARAAEALSRLHKGQ